MPKHFYQLMLVTEVTKQDSYITFIEKILPFGITAVQLRWKDANYKAIYNLGTALKPLLRRHNIPLIVNDSLKLASDLDADGLHLGQADGDIITARNALGSKKIIGLSVSSVDESLVANALPLDYVGTGAVFPTNSKRDATIIGLNTLQSIVKHSRHKVIAIGGINESNITDTLSTGINGVAIISAIHHAHDPCHTTHSLSTSITSHQSI